MPLNRIIWQQKNKLPQKILSVYKYTTLKIVVTPSFNVSVVVFLIIKIGSQAWDSLLFVPPGRCANSSQNCHPCSFCSHKQRCWTVLSELWPKVAFNSNTFFLELEAMNNSESAEDTRIAIHQNVCSRSFSQNCWRIFKNFRGTSHSTSQQRLDQFIVLLKLKSTFFKE